MVTLKAEKLKIDRWRESIQVTAQVKTLIDYRLQWLPQSLIPMRKWILKVCWFISIFMPIIRGRNEPVWLILSKMRVQPKFSGANKEGGCGSSQHLMCCFKRLKMSLEKL